MNLDEAAKLAVEKHRRLLCMNAIELAFGELVRMDGCKAVRKILLTYLAQLRWYR